MNSQTQPQYRGFPPAAAATASAHRSPYNPTGAARRGPGPMVTGPHAQGPHPSAHAQAHHAEMHRAREEAKRLSNKPRDLELPEGLEKMVGADLPALYKDLREYEKKLDATMLRKHLEYVEAAKHPPKEWKTLRIWIYNIAENQPWQTDGLDENAFDFDTGVAATFRVKMEARLLDYGDEIYTDREGTRRFPPRPKATRDENDMEVDGAEEEKESEMIKSNLPRKKLSTFFKALTVEFDKPCEIPTIEWTKPPIPDPENPPDAADFDMFHFERKGDENVNITIKLYRDEDPERYQLSPELADAIDYEAESKPRVLECLFDYARIFKLRDESDPRIIHCDDALKAVFHRDTIFFPDLPDMIEPHLSPLKPYEMQYTIHVDPEYIKNPKPTIYDVSVQVDDPIVFAYNVYFNNPSRLNELREIAALDEQTAGIMEEIRRSKARWEFFHAYAEDPVGFTRRWISSQQRDLEIITGDSVRGGGEDGLGEEWRRGGEEGVWGSEHVKEAVRSMLSRPPK
ncbi:MAG: SWI/SNF complex component snf12 [Piccolia ochrophora]|nr:MAG: SWI/SNF complex component snf12 [Piccolia ochrophora]